MRKLASEFREVKLLNLGKKFTLLQVKVVGFIFTPLQPESKSNLLKYSNELLVIHYFTKLLTMFPYLQCCQSSQQQVVTLVIKQGNTYCPKQTFSISVYCHWRIMVK